MSEPTLHRAYRLSGIGRPIDPDCATNRAVLVLIPLALIAGTVYGALQGASWVAAAGAGVNLALAVFVAWALTRELAPDEERVAFVAMAITAVAWVAWGRQSILLPVVALMAVRLVNRSTGKAAEPVDTVLLTVGFAAVAWLVSWTAGLVGAVALVLDAALPPVEGQMKRTVHLLAGIVVFAVTGPVWLPGLAAAQAPEAALPLGALVVSAALVGGLYPTPTSLGDVDRRPLAPVRVRAGSTLGVATLALAALDPAVGSELLSVGWAALAALLIGVGSRWIPRLPHSGAEGAPRT